MVAKLLFYLPVSGNIVPLFFGNENDNPPSFYSERHIFYLITLLFSLWGEKSLLNILCQMWIWGFERSYS